MVRTGPPLSLSTHDPGCRTAGTPARRRCAPSRRAPPYARPDRGRFSFSYIPLVLHPSTARTAVLEGSDTCARWCMLLYTHITSIGLSEEIPLSGHPRERGMQILYSTSICVCRNVVSRGREVKLSGHPGGSRLCTCNNMNVSARSHSQREHRWSRSLRSKQQHAIRCAAQLYQQPRQDGKMATCCASL